jgi:hypothetical protein
VDPNGTTYWHIQYYPTVLFLNAKGQLVDRSNGAMTLAQARRVLSQTLQQSAASVSR